MSQEHVEKTEECKHPRLHLIEPRKAAQCLDCGKCYPYDIDMDASGYEFSRPWVYARKKPKTNDEAL